MLYIEEDGVVRLTRGDSATFTVALVYKDTDTPYEIGENDTVTMTVKKSTKNTEFVMQKTVVGSNNISIQPSDTKGLAFGKYKYDVQLTTASGDVYTVIEPTTFEVLQEVTW